MSWKIHNDAYAERSDGVVASYIFHGAYPFAVTRELKKPQKRHGHKIFNEFMPGRAKAARTFKTLEGAMAGADKTWPLAPD